MKTFYYIFILAINSSLAFANDSSATLAAGGLKLIKSADISMESEVLYISPKRIKVDYIFKNNSSNDIKTLVAFPLPKLMSDETMQYESAGIPNEKSENFVNFKVSVNNQPVSVNIEHKALLSDNKQQNTQDITLELQRQNIPISPFSANYREILNNLPAPIKQKLVAKKWISSEKYDAGEGWVVNNVANWETQTSLYWEQIFPAQTEVTISHEYEPVVGKWFVMTGDTHYHQQFCVDKSTRRGIDKLHKSVGEDAYGTLLANQVKYILKTANNWQGAIKKFKLIIDKEKPSNIISLCLPDIKKINATQFSLEYENFIPKNDLNILVIENMNVQ
ncbi:MAG: DUF4424 domain-containing protein [Methylococcaceae bacterium]|nr:DUF4424 domain-containing protein [Methylococcaceae bacterium]